MRTFTLGLTLGATLALSLACNRHGGESSVRPSPATTLPTPPPQAPAEDAARVVDATSPEQPPAVVIEGDGGVDLPSCSEAETAAAGRALGVPAEGWSVACARLGGGRAVVAAVSATATAPGGGSASELDGGPLTVLTERLGIIEGGRVVWREERSPARDLGEPAPSQLTPSERFEVRILPVALGDDHGVQVGLVGHFGEDYATSTEVATLFRLRAGPPSLGRVWTGVGSITESRMGACVIAQVASFRLVNATTLERTVRAQASFTPQDLTGEDLRRLRRECRAPRGETRRFTLP